MRNDPSGDAGFTLVELLVVSVLLGLIGLLAADGIRFGDRAWEGVSGRLEQAARVRATVEIVRGLVAGSLPDRQDPGGLRGGLSGDAGRLELRARDLTGVGDYSLRMVNANAPAQGAGRMIQIIQIIAAAGTGAPEGDRRLLGPFDVPEFAYRADGMVAGQWSPLWQADWPLPDLLRLRLDGQEAVIRIPLSHPSACSVVPVELGCGR